MNRFLAALVWGAMFLATVEAQQPAQPAGAPPQIMVVQSVFPDKGVAVLTVPKTVTQMVPVTVEKTVVVNGVEMKVKETAYQQEMRVTLTQKTWTAGKDQAYDSGGNPLAKEALFQRLQAGTAVLVTHSQKPSATYLRLLSKDAVVLVLSGAP